MPQTKLLIITLLFMIGGLSFSIAQSNLIPLDAKKFQLDGKEYYLHVVAKGEGLYRISVNYGVSMKEILKANPDLDESLKLGQIVRVPIISGRNSDSEELQKSRQYIFHTVEKGQTAYFIARKYNLTLDQLYSFNAGIENGLVLGTILKIPTSITEKETVKKEDNQPVMVKGNGPNFIIHTVRPKETLYSISKQYTTTVESIIQDNPALRNGILSVGTEIRIAQTKSVSDLNADFKTDASTLTTTPNATGEFITTDDYIYHLIEPGQTLYSISRQYLIDVSDLRNANPDVDDSGLRTGYLLRIPRPKKSDLNLDLAHQKENERWFHNHTVRRRETLFGISQKYHVDIDIIQKVNPGVNFSNLGKGVALKIPKDEWFAARNLAALVEEEKVDSTETPILYDECILNQELGYTRPIKVSLLMPFNANESSKYYSNQTDSSGVTRDVISIAQRARVFTEFYSGTLLALDSLKLSGIDVDLSVVDISPDSIAIKRALLNPDLKQSDLIIGPGLGHELKWISDFSKQNAIPLVFPISNNTNGEIFSNSYLFQINSPDSLQFDKMAEELVSQSIDANLLIILPPKNEKEALLFVQKIKEEAARQISLNKKINYIEYQPRDNDLVAIQALVSKDIENYVVVPSVAASEISKIIPVLKGVKEKSKANISLFGRSEWLRMQTIDPEDIYYLNTTIFSSFRIDYEKENTRNFIAKYRSWFNMEPHAISPYFQYSDATSGFSRFGIWGFDVTYYFISAIAQYGENFDLCLDQIKHDEIQFNFDFKRVSNWGGFYNNGFFKLKFTPDLKTIQKPVIFNN